MTSFSAPREREGDAVNYGRVARLLHWLIAALVFIMLAIGWCMDLFPKEWKTSALGIHKSIGILILLLATIRLIWRLRHHAPQLPAAMPAWEIRAALSAHYLLYALLFAMPLTGWAMTSAKGRPAMFLGVIPLPDLVAPDKALGHNLESLHGYLAYALAALIAFHAAAALYHHYILKDNILMRMRPPLWKKSAS